MIQIPSLPQSTNSGVKRRSGVNYGTLYSAGYDSMGYELSKPMLRAELEADLKRCALAVSIVSCVATVYTIHV